MIAALVCVYETWFVLACSKVLAPWDTGFKARALRAVRFSPVTAPAVTSSEGKNFLSLCHLSKSLCLHHKKGLGPVTPY